MRARFSDRRRGSAAILLTMMLTFLLLPLTGLAIDGSIQYLVRTKLSAAVDASALAGARSLSKGMDLAAQTASAEATVRKFFAANFPEHFWRTSNVQLNIDIAETALKTRSVTVRASLVSPLYFLRILGFDTTNVAVEGRASRRDVNIMLVLDRSTSLEMASACDDLRAASKSFVNSFAEGRDRLGMITYGGTYRTDFAPSMTFKTASPKSLSVMIDDIDCVGITGSAQALSKGYEKLLDLHEPGSLNVILFFTDGQPNTITATFPIKKVTTTYSPTGKSTCKDDAGRSNTSGLWDPQPKVGVVGAYGSAVSGIFRPDMTQLPATMAKETQIITGYSGCYFASNSADVYKDIAHIPDEDLYHNSIWGYKTNLEKYTSGTYKNKARIDRIGTFEAAAINALDNAAKRMRQDASNPVLIYTIGLGGAGEAEHTLLRRVSNDPLSPIYDPDYPVGMYVYAPTVAQLSDAFYRIASEILRLAL